MGKKINDQNAEYIRAISISFEKNQRLLVLRLQGGAVVSLPVDKIQGSASASDKAIAAVELMPRGIALHWESLDLDFSVSGLVAGIGPKGGRQSIC